jgi:hypothetical protein
MVVGIINTSQFKGMHLHFHWGLIDYIHDVDGVLGFHAEVIGCSIHVLVLFKDSITVILPQCIIPRCEYEKLLN